MKIERDNSRILRLRTTEECRNYWEKRDPDDIKSIISLFEGLDDSEIKSLFEIIMKLEKNI